MCLAAVIVLVCASCDGSGEEEITVYEEETEAVIPGGSLSVPYYSTDSLNPFYCETVLNCALTSLTYRYLYTLDTSFEAVKDMALSESLSGLVLKVYINPDLVFSDGSALTAADVKYSFDCAKYSDRYKATLAGISGCYRESDSCAVFELKAEDVNVINCLTFPIVKNGTAADSDALPTGNGFYQYSRDGIRLSLKANLRYAGDLPDIGTVRLTDVKGNASPENLVGTQEIDFCYSDLSDADTSGVNCSATGIYLNNLVYMGVNHANVNLVLASFRQAISFGIDRTSLSDNAFMGYARAAAVPFNTSWSGYAKSLSASSVSLTADTAKTQQLLSERAFGVDGHPLDLVLVCNEGNAFIRNTANEIAAALAPCNINITVRLLSSSDLKKAVQSGAYDLYIAEIKLPANMDLSEFFSYGGAASYGMIFDNLTCDEAYFSYKKGEISLDDFIMSFNKDMPFIPLAYRNGRFLYTRDVTSELTASEGFFFKGIDGLTFSETRF